MTNKKLWLSLLVVVLVVCMLSVTLFACNKDDSKKQPTPAPGPTVEAQAIDAIINGIKASVEDGDMTDLKVDGTLGLTLGDKEYALKLALELDLLQFNGYNYEKASGEFDPKGEYFTKSGSTYSKVENPDSSKKDNYYVRVSRKDVEKANTSNTKINAELKDVKANNVLLGLYYWDGAPNADMNPNNTDIYSGNYLFLQAKTKTEQKKVYFPAPNIAAVQNAKDGQVDFHGIDLADEDVWGSVDTVTGIIAGLASEGVCTSTEASITLKIGDLLDPNNENNLLSLVGGLQDWLDALDLDIDATALGELLPNISLVLSATLDDGKATGFDISLKLAEKDMEIKNKSNAHTVIKIDMTKDVEVGLSLDYTIGTCTPWMNDFTGFVYQENILDAKISVDLYLGEAIEMDIANMLHLKVPAGYYTLSAEIAANPWSIIEKINNGIDFSTTPKMIDSIKEILQAVNALDLDLVNTKDKDGVAIAADKQQVLRVFVGNMYQKTGDKYQLVKNTNGSVKKNVTLATTILSSSSATLKLTGADIDAAINLIISVMGKSDKASEAERSSLPGPSTAEEDATTKLLQTIGGYLLGAYIGINDGTHGGLYASFDSSLTTNGYIPFSGYTKWSGAYTDAYDYYTVKANTGTMVKATAFEEGKLYSTKVAAHFEEVDKSKTEFDKFRQYYTWDGAKYVENSDTAFATDKTYYIYVGEKWVEQPDLTEFAPATEYYYWVDAEYEKVTITEFADKTDYYVKAGTGAKDFKGIGLQASLAIDDGIAIDATVTNMNIFGLPASLSAKISNLQISVFNNDYPIYFTASTFGTYQDVVGKIVG